MSLPTEIVDSILGFLQSDTATLKACLQSHPIIAELAERHLYTNVTVSDEIPPDQNDFCEAVRDRPHIANHVRRLEIRFIQHWGKTILKVISPILPKLLRLQRIRLIYTHYENVEFSHMIPKKFRQAFKECLRLPSLTEIFIENMSFPLSALSRCKHISKLSLDRWSPDGSVDTSALPTIDSLALHTYGDDSISQLSHWIQSRNLSSLKYSNPSFLRALPLMLTSCSHSLTILTVHIPVVYSTRYDFKMSTTFHPKDAIPIPLSLLNLEQLTIRAVLSYEFSSRQLQSPIPAITELVKSASPVRVRKLTLDFTVIIKSYEDDEQQITDAIRGSIHLLLMSADAIHSIGIKARGGDVEMFVPRELVENRRVIVTPAVKTVPR